LRYHVVARGIGNSADWQSKVRTSGEVVRETPLKPEGNSNCNHSQHPTAGTGGIQVHLHSHTFLVKGCWGGGGDYTFGK